MKTPTLLVLAAGMGSRYGSLKQMDGVGPSGEAILDYSVYDAVRAGFSRVVFVIRKDFAEDFRAVFNSERFGRKIEVEYAYQELERLPKGFAPGPDRVKPWGTNHAVMMGADKIDGPFAVINADDFYGRDAFRVIAGYLGGLDGTDGRYCMVGYDLRNTLSEHGSVSRGVCTVDDYDNLVSLTERTRILRKGDGIVYIEGDTEYDIDPHATVSMNLFGFTPDYFRHSEDAFTDFLVKNAGNPTAEFYIPLMVNRLISDGKAQLKVLHTSSRWFGVTYKEDRPAVEQRLRDLVAEGEYPVRLWA